jgi:integrase
MASITDIEINKKPGKSDHWLSEPAIWGHGSLVVRITPAGERLFYFRYLTENGSRDTLQIGTYDRKGLNGCMTLSDARSRAAELASLHKSGIRNVRKHLEEEITLNKARQQAEAAQVSAAKARAEAEAARLASRTTVSGLFELWSSVELTNLKDSGSEVRRLFNKDVLPVIGTLCIEDVKVGHITQVLDPVLQRGANRMAKLALTYLRQMFGFALDRELVQHDPTARLRKSRVGGREVERNRVLSESEISLLFSSIQEAGLMPASQCAICICLATCCRIGELLSARWDHIDLGRKTWFIPAEHSKNGKPHTVHLSCFSVEQFSRLAIHNGQSEWCYPNTKNTGPVCAKTMSKQVGDRQLRPDRKPMANRSALCHSLELPGGRWTLHDLRRTGATMMVAMQVIPEVAERCLNHAEQNRIKRTYQHHSYAKEMKQAWDLLGERLVLLARNDATNVITLSSRSH